MNKTKNEELLIRLDERMLDIQKDLKEIKETVFGNGKEGLCTKIIKQDDDMQNIKIEHIKEQEKTRWLISKALTIFTIIVTVVFAVINYLKI